jgi:hypothetical protein
MKKKSSDTEQSKRFIEAAKKAEADETDEGANQAFKRAVATTTLTSKREKK